MSVNSFQTTILGAQVTFTRRNFLKPMRLSSGPIHDVTEAVAEVTVSVNGKEATGRGTIYLSDLWAWPDALRTHEDGEAGMRQYCTALAENLASLCGNEAAHSLHLGLRLHRSLHAQEAPDGLPLLARRVCGRPFDAALHDAVGIAIKACHGHSFALVAAAWAREQGMLLAMQDLTNPGLVAIQAALFAAYLPVCNGLELNSPQYTPEANAEWLPRLDRLFAPTNGCHYLPLTHTVGLGSAL